MTLSRDEAIAILEEIARDPKNATARIQAIRLLEEMRSDERRSDGFEDLDEVAERRARSGGRGRSA
jgi:hypothetical protein